MELDDESSPDATEATAADNKCDDEDFLRIVGGDLKRGEREHVVFDVACRVNDGVLNADDVARNDSRIAVGIFMGFVVL